MNKRQIEFCAEQLLAIQSEEKNTLVQAGPGSGKTAVIAARIERLLAAGCPAAEIGLISYTNNGVREIIDRLPMEEGEPVELGFAGTLHAFGVRHLGTFCIPAVSVMGSDEAKETLAQIARDLKCRSSAKWLLSLMTAGANEDDDPAGTPLENLVVQTYERTMESTGIYDFDSLLRRTLYFLTIHPENQRSFRHLFVDEFQDISTIDLQILLGINAENRFFVGDADQEIFGFLRGVAGMSSTETLSSSWPTFWLEGNYRSKPEICAAANRLMLAADSKRSHRKTISRATIPGGKVSYHLIESLPNPSLLASFIRDKADGSSAVLARTNRLVEEVTFALQAASMPIARQVTALPADWPAALAALRMLAERSEQSVKRWLYATDRKNAEKIMRQVDLGKDTLSRFLTFREKVTDLDLDAAMAPLREMTAPDSFQWLGNIRDELPPGASLGDWSTAAARYDGRREISDSPDAIYVGTIHSAKGREWDSVFLYGFEDEIIPGKHDIEEERRIAYVGITRAISALWLIAGTRRRYPYPPFDWRPANVSRFIGEALGWVA